jgi:hypothetical protein
MWCDNIKLDVTEQCMRILTAFVQIIGLMGSSGRIM